MNLSRRNLILITVALVTTHLYSCQNKGKSYTVNTQPERAQHTLATLPLDFQSLETEGIAIGDSIVLLNDSLMAIDTLINEGKIVQITGISELLMNGEAIQTSGTESAQVYLRIKTSLGDAIVDGKQIYSPSSSFAPKEMQIGNTKLSFVRLKNYELDTTKNSTTTSSPSHYPILFINSDDGYKGLITQTNNSIFESDFPFFEVLENDQIREVNLDNGNILLLMERKDKNNLASLRIKILKDAIVGYRAEIIDIENIKK